MEGYNVLTEEEKAYAKELEEDFPTELLLIKEADSEQYEAFIKKLVYDRYMATEYEKRLRAFIELAAKATDQPYLLNTTLDFAVDNVLAHMSDKWIIIGEKQSFKQVFLNVLLKLIYGLIAFSPLVLFVVFYWMKGGQDPKAFIILGFLIPSFITAAALYAMTEKWMKNKRKSE